MILDFRINEGDSGQKSGAALDTLVKKDDERAHQGNDAKNNKSGKKRIHVDTSMPSRK